MSGGCQELARRKLPALRGFRSRAILVIAWSVVEAGEAAWANKRRMYSGNYAALDAP
jgi:hypothetical protein